MIHSVFKQIMPLNEWNSISFTLNQLRIQILIQVIGWCRQWITRASMPYRLAQNCINSITSTLSYCSLASSSRYGVPVSVGGNVTCFPKLYRNCQETFLLYKKLHSYYSSQILPFGIHNKNGVSKRPVTCQVNEGLRPRVIWLKWLWNMNSLICFCNGLWTCFTRK